MKTFLVVAHLPAGRTRSRKILAESEILAQGWAVDFAAEVGAEDATVTPRDDAQAG